MEREFKVTFSSEDKNFGAGFQKASKEVQDAFNNIIRASKFTGNQKNYFDSLRESLAAYEKDMQRQIADEKRYLSERREFARKRGGGYYTEAQQREFKESSKGIQAMEDMQQQMRSFMEEFISAEKERIINEKKTQQEQRLLDKQQQLEEKTDNKKEREDKKKSKDDDERKKQRDARIVDVIGTVNRVIGSNNIYQAIATSVPGVTSMITGNPIINAISSLIGKGLERGYEEGARYTKSAAGISVITGKSQETYLNRGFRRDKYGYSALEEYSEVMSQIDADKETLKKLRETSHSSATLEEQLRIRKSVHDRFSKVYNMSGIDAEERALSNTILLNQNRLNQIKGSAGSEFKELSPYFDAKNIGLNPAEFNELISKTARASGFYSPERALGVGQLNRIGIDEGISLQLERQGRISGLSAKQATESMYSNLFVRGGMREDNLALLPEYMQQLIDVNSQQLEELGFIREDSNAGKIAAMSAITSGGPDAIRQLMPKMKQGFSESQNPYARALQYQVLSEMGETDVFEMRKKMEDPLANRDYIRNVVLKIKQISGGNRGLGGSMLSSFMGGNISQTQGENLYTLSNEDWTKFAKEWDTSSKEFKEKFGVLDIKGKAEGLGTTDWDKRTADWVGKIQEAGVSLLQNTEAMLKFFERMQKDTDDMAKKLGITSKSVIIMSDSVVVGSEKVKKNLKNG